MSTLRKKVLDDETVKSICFTPTIFLREKSNLVYAHNVLNNTSKNHHLYVSVYTMFLTGRKLSVVLNLMVIEWKTRDIEETYSTGHIIMDFFFFEKN